MMRPTSGGRTMLGWEELETERNRRSVLRLNKALPSMFPRAVLVRALLRPFVPPTPRLAVESYWRAHPIRADRLARALAARSHAPEGWAWRLGDRRSGLPFTFRTPPAPYREAEHALGPDFAACAVNQFIASVGTLTVGVVVPTRTRFGACVIAWQFWKPRRVARSSVCKVGGCAQSGGRLWRNAEVDHRVPLFRVWSEHRDTPWPRVLDFWGLPNLQVINRDIHAAKCATEARDPRIARPSAQTHLG
jgi:hypothetical protein